MNERDKDIARQASVSMPRYRSHKIVSAAKITDVERNALVEEVDGADKPFASRIIAAGSIVFMPSVEWFDHFKPAPGAYLVIYEDGYASVSPSKAFEEGYTRI